MEFANFPRARDLYGHDPANFHSHILSSLASLPITNMVNVCKLLSDQFTAEKAANGMGKGCFNRAIKRGFADRATGKLADQCTAVQAMVKISFVRRF